MGVGDKLGKARVDRQHGAAVEVLALAQVAPHRQEIAVDSLQRELEPREGVVESLPAGDELLLHEGAERGRVPVLRAPPAPHLIQSARDACLLGGSMPSEQRLACGRGGVVERIGRHGDRGENGGGRRDDEDAPFPPHHAMP